MKPRQSKQADFKTITREVSTFRAYVQNTNRCTMCDVFTQGFRGARVEKPARWTQGIAVTTTIENRTTNFLKTLFCVYIVKKLKRCQIKDGHRKMIRLSQANKNIIMFNKTTCRKTPMGARLTRKYEWVHDSLENMRRTLGLPHPANNREVPSLPFSEPP